MQIIRHATDPPSSTANKHNIEPTPAPTPAPSLRVQIPIHKLRHTATTDLAPTTDTKPQPQPAPNPTPGLESRVQVLQPASVPRVLNKNLESHDQAHNKSDDTYHRL